MKNYILLFLLLVFACKPEAPKTLIEPWVPYDESEELAENASHPSPRMQFKLIQSPFSDRNKMWADAADQISNFSEGDYQRLKPLILEQDIPTLQSNIESGKLSYETLTQWYIYRIVKYENDRNKSLHNMISINPEAVNEAKKRDRNKSENDHPIYGMPIILKDNIGLEGLPTTAGTHALKDNNATDAFITARIKDKGGIILGKSNLSEWANYFCFGCPNGYSAAGGQTLNPYGRKKFDTGGSSSGSGSTIAANYAAAAVGTETSGSILSPSSSNSLVGLKPTVGLLSRGGIVPLSSTLDTPGPMTKNVIDNAILLSAMTGEDAKDPATKDNPKGIDYWVGLTSESIKGLRFGVIKPYLRDSIYSNAVEKIKSLGGIAIEFEFERIGLPGFGNLLSADMKLDMVNYLRDYASKEVQRGSIADIVAYNKSDSATRMPYGQGRFESILDVNVSEEDLQQIRKTLNENGVKFFEGPMTEHKLDAILSINNQNAGHAAVAKYPCLTVPMGYRSEGQPRGLTFISRPFEENKLLKMAYAFEKATKARKIPIDYN